MGTNRNVAIFWTAALGLSAGCGEVPNEPGAREWAIEEKASEPTEVMQVCDKDFVVVDGTKARALLYCATADVQATGRGGPTMYPGYRRLVITQHGRGGNARMYFDTTFGVASKVANDAGTEARTSFIVAPQLLSQAETPPLIGFTPGYHFEWGGNWPLGGLSKQVNAADFTRASYDLLDQLIAAAVARLPDLEEVVIVGQSAGGQLVNRYAAANQVKFPPGVNVRYVPMNPQSWLYLDGERPYPELALIGDQIDPGDQPVDLAQVCPDWDDYHTGLVALDSYSYFKDRQLTAQTLRSQYMTRRLHYMAGELDTDDPDGAFICLFRVQGKNRNLRAKAYIQHVTDFYAPFAVNHDFHEVPGVGHGHKGMYESPCGRRYVFDDLNAICL